MEIVTLLIAGFLIVMVLIYTVTKVFIAYDHCSGGAPLLDGYVIPPLVLGVISAIVAQSLRINMSGFAVALVTFIVVSIAYQIAWWIGKRRKH